MNLDNFTRYWYLLHNIVMNYSGYYIMAKDLWPFWVKLEHFMLVLRFGDVLIGIGVWLVYLCSGFRPKLLAFLFLVTRLASWFCDLQ